MNRKQFLLYKKLLGRINHRQLLNEYVLHSFFAIYQTLLIVNNTTNSKEGKMDFLLGSLHYVINYSISK